MSRKAFTVAVVATTIAWSIGLSALLAPLSVSAAASGSLVKASLPAVYYVGSDGKRYVFPNEKTYKTWYADFSTVQTITDAELASMAIGGNVTYKPGVRMVKITTDPKVYAVDAHGALRWVSSEAVAVALYGASWNQMIDDVPDAFFTNYTVGADIASASGYSPSGVASAATSINSDKNLTGFSGSGTLAAMLSANQPMGGTLPQSATGVTMLKVDVRNGGTSALTVDSLTLRRTGPGQTSDFSAVYVNEGNNRLTTGRTLNSTSNEATFSGLNLPLGAGETKSLWFSADIAASGTGDVNSLSLVGLNAGSTAASGLPLSGPSFTWAGVGVGTVTINKGSTLSNPKAGQLAAKLAEFKLTAGGTEDISLNKVALYYAGTVNRSNITNLVLKQNGVTLATVAGLTGKDLAVFVLATPMSIDKGNTRTFEVYGDISGTSRSTESIKFYIDQDADVLAVGKTYGYGVSVVNADFDGSPCTVSGDDCSVTAVEAGQLTTTFNGPASKDIGANSKDVELFNFTMAGASNLEVKKTRLILTGVPAGSEAEVKDLKITDVATGATVAGPLDGVNGTVNYDFTEVYNLAAGQARTFKVTADIDTAAVAGHTYKVTLDLPTFAAANVRNLDNSTNLVAADFVPSSNIAGNAHTIKKASLAVSVSSTPVTQTIIQGAAGVGLIGLGLKAGDASDIRVSSIKLTAYVDDAGGVFVAGTEGAAVAKDIVSTASLWDGSTQVGATKSPATDGTMVFDNLNLTIAKGATKSLVLKGTLASSIASLQDRVKLDIAANADVSATDADGNSLVAGVNLTGCPINGTTADSGVRMTVKASGTITVELASDDVESEAGIVVGGASNAVLAKYKFTATDEELKLTKASLAVVNPAAVVSLSLYDGSTLVGGPASVDGSGEADFSSLNFVIPKDGSKVLTVKANLNSISGSGAVTGSDATVTLLDTGSTANSQFEVRGTSAGSSTNLTTAAALDLNGNAKIVRKSKPTVSISIPNTTLADGNKVVLRVTVAADAAGDVALGQIKLDSVASLAAGTLALVTTPLTNTIQEVNGDFLTASAVTFAAPLLTITLASEKTIMAGTSKSFDIFLKVTGSAASDSITSNLKTDAADATGTLAGLVANNFVWSDISAVGHGLGTADWAAGWKVKGLTSPGVTMSK